MGGSPLRAPTAPLSLLLLFPLLPLVLLVGKGTGRSVLFCRPLHGRSRSPARCGARTTLTVPITYCEGVCGSV